MKTTFSTQYSIYYNFGSVHSSSIVSDTLQNLRSKIKDFIFDSENKPDVECVIFEPIQKKTVKIIETKGSMAIFKTLTNKYLSPNLKKYYKRLK